MSPRVLDAEGRPRLLDLFCGAGGCTKGYQEAGFYVVGVDVKPQPNYCGDEFHQADALEFLTYELPEFDAIHASPPCQNQSTLKARWQDREHPELIGETRELLEATGLPYVIENVEGAKAVLREPTMLCGTTFGLPLRRHRLFETNFPLMSPGCSHGAWPARFDVYEHGKWRKTAFVPVYGYGGGKEREAGPAAMGIDWMNRAELTQAIPPAYTRFIGEQLMALIDQPTKEGSRHG